MITSDYVIAAAHGVSGILHTLLLACKMYDPAELYPGLDVPKLIEQSTVALAASLQGNNGNLPSTWGYEDDRCASKFLRLSGRAALLHFLL